SGRLQSWVVYAVEMEGGELRAPRVVIGQSDRRTGDLFEVLETEAGSQAATERRLPRPEIAVQQDMGRQRHRLRQFAPGLEGVVFRLGNYARICSHTAPIKFSRAVATKGYSPIYSAVRSTAKPCKWTARRER